MLDAETLHIDETPIRCYKSDRAKGYMRIMSNAYTGATLHYWKNSHRRVLTLCNVL